MTVGDDLNALYNDRGGIYGDTHSEIDKLVGIYEGRLPPEFEDYFAPEMHVHVINMIRLAWDDLATMAGKEFPLYVRPHSSSQRAKDQAERLEKIGYGYNENGRDTGGITMKLLQKVQNWWLVGAGSSVGMTLPHYETKRPFFTWRDPRTFYPPGGWSPFTSSQPQDALFVYPITLGELKRRYPERANELDRDLGKTEIMLNGVRKSIVHDDNWVLQVGEYYNKDTWIVATMTDKVVRLARSDTGDPGHPELVPVWAYGLFSASGAKGRSLFADQVSIQAAMARMFSQKLDFYDRMLYPLIFHTPLSNEKLRMGPNAANTFDVSSGVPPRVETIQPAHSIDADQTMAFAIGMSRMLNRNPESMQGQGEADSAKALTELKAGITTTIRDWIWPPQVEALPKAYELAAKLEVKLWPNDRRSTSGSRRNQPYQTEYVPAVHLSGNEARFRIEPGLGLAGYQGTLEILQLYQAELIPEDLALEQGEWVRDVQEAKRGIQLDRLAKLNWAALAAMAEQGMLAPDAIALLIQDVEEGKDLNQAIKDRKAANQLLAPPPEPMGAAPPGMGAPGLPPGAPPIPPQLAVLRGGR